MAYPKPSAVIELLKPITWFPPMWAFGCGVVSSGVSLTQHWLFIIAGIILAGPMVCATSQAVNDWFDRHVDAINEPHRPIPSGRIPGQWGLYIAIIWSTLSLVLAAFLGMVVFVITIIALALAWAYSAPPFRLKKNGWWGNSAVAISYEGIAWVTGAAVMLAAVSGTAVIPDWRILLIAFLYSAGAHGIMTLNDFKSIEGDTRMGLGSLPVRLGPEKAGIVACFAMAVPQMVVIALLFAWQQPVHASAVFALLAVQIILMVRLLRRPRELAPWYNATGVSLYVLGMLVTAFALRNIVVV